MRPIPVSAARRVADEYGYDQVVIIARKVDRPAGIGETAKQAIKGGEHVTTYGVDRANCDVAARVGDFIKHELMRWPRKNSMVLVPIDRVVVCTGDHGGYRTGECTACG